MLFEETVLMCDGFIGTGRVQMAEGAFEDWLRKAGQFLQSDLTGSYFAIIQRVMSADWRNPDEMAEVLLKELARYDLQHMYSKFMVTCLLFWIAPEEMRKVNRFELGKEHDEVFRKVEASFNVMWIAYERWMARGFTHYVDVLSSLGKFYSELRWGANLHRQPEGFVSGIDDKIAEQTYFYLNGVQTLVKKSYEDFQEEIRPVLNKLRPADLDKERGE